MRHRPFSNPFMVSGTDQHENNHSPVEQYYAPTGRGAAPENGSFVGSMDHMIRGGVRTESRWNSEGRPDQYTSSNVSMEVQHFAPAFSGPLVDNYPPSSVPGNTSLAPPTSVGHVHSTQYNIPSIHDVDGDMLNSVTGTRQSLKRKSPDISGSFEGGSSSNFYAAGSSSGSQRLMVKPAADCQSVNPYRTYGLSISGEGSMRNVRSRTRLELEPSMTRTHAPSYSSHYYQSTTDPVYYSAPVQPANSNADATNREWNCIPHFTVSSHGRISPPGITDINATRHEANQFHVGGSSIGVDGGRPDSVFSRHPMSSSHYHHGLHAPPSRDSHSNHSRRFFPSYRSSPSYTHYAHGGTSSTNGFHPSSDGYSSRYSRHFNGGGWRSSNRSGRSRIAVERFQPIFSEAQDRMGHESMMTVDRTSLYGNSRTLFDQHRDMRLDIDSMSYEELLALEERIGNVNTGLSEDSLSKFLREKVHCSLDEHHEEVSCPICLEEYVNGDKIGRMEKCGHVYHTDCIKKWLVMKKVCPICKSECSTEG